MAVVAHALVLGAIERPKTVAIMALMMEHIVDAAYMRNTAAAGSTGAGTGQKFAEELFATCVKTGRNMGAILDRRS
jgi:hypothetical protein